MSGFVAMVGGCSDADWRWIQQATEYLSFRGPHGQAAWRDTSAAMGHALLRTCAEDARSVIPLTLDGETWISGDVRLDARDDLCADLRALGVGASMGRPDLELVLHAYEAWEAGCVAHLAGDFAFAIWDRRRGRLFCARDQFGVAPLFYARCGARLLVGNTLDAMLMHPEMSAELDDSAIADFLLFNLNADLSTTTFASVRRLPPAHSLTWHGAVVSVQRYWSMPDWTGFASFDRPADCVERFRELLTAAVSDRLGTDRLSVQLSGGLDSTSVAAVTHQLLTDAGKPFEIRAHTVVGGSMEDDEGRYVRMVGERLGIAVDYLVSTGYAETDPLERPPVVPPEPGPYVSSTLQYDLARRATDAGHVALSGLGGDALLMFIPSYWIDWLARGEVMRLAAAVAHGLRLFHRPPPLFPRAALRHWRRVRRESLPVPDWIQQDLAERIGLEDRAVIVSRASLASIDTRGMADSPFWTGLFGRADPGFTRHPVKYRHPLFDLRLVSYVLSLPPAPWLVRKRVLRDAMHGVLPESVRERPKTPLAALWSPPARRRDADDRVVELVLASPALDRYVNRDRLVARLRSTVGADLLAHRALAPSLALAHWLYHWRRPASRPTPSRVVVRQQQSEVVA
ncbi:MAG TPA: asparagine synthase-related protein [Gemmatimonadaceae bacterium]|nr:asparagine synthase-related protein [Gemmatimonadaceae bacterium]